MARPGRALIDDLVEKEILVTTVKDAVVLVTGANGGIGSALVLEALGRGAAKVYATARTPKAWEDSRVVPLTLDVTDRDSIAAAVDAAPDVTVLINNAGATPPTASLVEIAESDLRANMEVNFFGPLLLAAAFAPTLIRNGDGALVDIHSVASWYAFGGAYSASKAALWSATNALRLELSPKGVLVVGVYMGYVDTPLAASASGEKLAPADLARTIADGIERGEYEVIGDALTANVRAGLSQPLPVLYPGLASPSA